ncbi:MAG: DUF5916 domain-containing protein [Saprospiraceae bacterium]
MKCFLVSIFLFTGFNFLLAGDSLMVTRSAFLHASKTSEKIVIDGDLTEAVWKDAELIQSFQEHWPQNARVPVFNTEAMITRDDQYLYIAFICHDSDKKYIIQSLKRDLEFEGNDIVSISIDPTGQKNTAYYFGISPKGVQAEGVLTRFDFNPNWDSKWFSGVKNYEDKWTAEMAIPLHILRYDPARIKWNVNFIRADAKNFRFYTWTKIPQQYDGIDLGYMGTLEWNEPLPSKGGQVTVIPYANLSTVKDFEDAANTRDKAGFGADAKITLSSKLNLDLTINPDFSQVEVDKQVTNLTRFDIFLPERRNFFLENADLFSQFGDPESPIFFSRRIGLDKDGNSVPIIGGARLTGNIGNSWRIGALSMQTKETKNQAGQNYSAVTLHRKILKRSQIKALFTNRQAMQGKEFSNTDYGRNASVEMVYQKENGELLSWMGLHKSFKYDLGSRNAMLSTGIGINKKKFSSFVGLTTVGTNYTADMGFVNQLDNYDAVRDTTIQHGFHNAFNFMNYTIRTPKSKVTSYHEFRAVNSVKITPGYSFTEWTSRLQYELAFVNSSVIQMKYVHNYSKLLYPFSFTDETPLTATSYDFDNLSLGYASDVRKTFGYKLQATAGTFYNGTIRSAIIGMKYRAQPWGNFEMNFEYNDLNFPDPFGEAKLFLINPRIEFNFSTKLFWTTFLQYNTQADNFNINSRFQWRYKPMSDIYLVYTDNYAVQFWGPKSRSLVFKVNYWLNL